MSNSFLPVSIALAGKKCLVIGGGKVALRKIETLLEFGADITVIAPEPIERIDFYGKKGWLKLNGREYRTPEAAEYDLVISASDDENVNRLAWADCDKGGTLINVVDNPVLCSFIFPAVVKRDALTVAVSTGGRAPFLARRLKLILEDIFPQHWARIVNLAGAFREKVRRSQQPHERALRYGRFLDMDWKEIISKMSDEEIDAVLDNLAEGRGVDQSENLQVDDGDRKNG